MTTCKVAEVVRVVVGAFLFSSMLVTVPAKAGLVEELEAVVDQNMATHGVPGALVGVWRQGSELAVFEKGVSDVDSGTLMSRLNHMRIASVTKSFTVTRILQLRDQDVLSLDDPISKYVPGVQNGDATLRQLANMTSGIFNYTENPSVVMELVNNPLKTWTDSELVAATAGYTPYFDPGKGWHYSNTNTVLLGMVVTSLTGQSFGQQVTSGILGPVGLSNTSYPSAPTLPTPFSHGYALFGPGAPMVDFTEVSPTAASSSGAMISTLDDLRIWGKELAVGSLLSADSQRERLEMVSTAGGVGPEYDAYGLGIGALDGWVGHTGDFPGFQSLVMHDTANDQTVVILINLSGSGHVPTEMFQQMSGLLAIPEPSAFFLLAASAIILVMVRRKRARRGYWKQNL
jgi:CubicO group peptidase (beta-lactamase class C family)